MIPAAQDQPASTQAGAPPLPVTLRAIAAWLESHEEIAARIHEISLGEYGHNTAHIYGLDADQMSTLARAIDGHWTKHADERLFELQQEIVPGFKLALVGGRERVCTRVVTGTRTVTEPDPEALAAVPTVTREVETYEWRCEPLLAAATGETA